MGVALVFLLRSMNKQLRKIDATPLEPGSADGDGSGAETADPKARIG
jgi:hypothetical protein